MANVWKSLVAVLFAAVVIRNLAARSEYSMEDEEADLSDTQHDIDQHKHTSSKQSADQNKSLEDPDRWDGATANSVEGNGRCEPDICDAVMECIYYSDPFWENNPAQYVKSGPKSAAWVPTQSDHVMGYTDRLDHNGPMS